MGWLRAAVGVGVLLALGASASRSAAEDPAQVLTAMAQARFGALSHAELTMLRVAPTRKLAWASPKEDPEDPLNDPAGAKSWGEERTIRAEVLAWLLSDAEASKLVHPSGVGLAGARIVGEL